MSTMIFLCYCTWLISMGETWWPQGPLAPSSSPHARCSRFYFSTIQCCRTLQTKKTTEFLPLKKIKRSSASMEISPNFHQKQTFQQKLPSKFPFLVEVLYLSNSDRNSCSLLSKSLLPDPHSTLAQQRRPVGWSYNDF